jgi:hypothetical protein
MAGLRQQPDFPKTDIVFRSQPARMFDGDRRADFEHAQPEVPQFRVAAKTTPVRRE